MLKGDAHIETRARDYRISESAKKGKEATNPHVPLLIKKMMGEKMTHIPKGAFNQASHNLNVRAAQNYSMVEYLAQAPCAMYALEVLKSYPS
jgi:hypothetical protein